MANFLKQSGSDTEGIDNFVDPLPALYNEFVPIAVPFLVLLWEKA